MKNLQLKAMEFGANEVLTRQQLKNTIGGVVRATCRCRDERQWFTMTADDMLQFRAKIRARCPDKVTSTQMPYQCGFN